MVIVSGDADQIVPAEQNAERLFQALPHSHFNVLPRTGHQIPFTRPEAVLAAIDQIAELSPES
jgi:pimeloyl-ACP methyl ester carboxylesterase